MIYDFILFENLYNVQNHYKDLKNLAILLKTAGYRVAIADAFKEANLCNVEGAPHISISIKCPREFKELSTYLTKRSALKKIYYRIRKDLYMYKVVKYLNSMTNNIYVGSMTLDTPVFFMQAFSSNKTYYIWALRSSNVMLWKNGVRNIQSVISKALYKNIYKFTNLRLVVSNELIKKEFEEQVGIDTKRLILRPERVIKEKHIIAGKGMKGQSLNLLFIGTLRAFKNVEFCLKALAKMNDSRISYIIAGRCKSDEHYNDTISKLASELSNVRRIDRYISDEEYEQLMIDCDYLVLCDKKQASCASNGTMTEALLHGKPIIAPDFNPFKYEIEKYNIGYMYKYDDVDSLCEVLNFALKHGTEKFKEPLLTYQEMFLEERIVNSIKEQIEL